MKTKPKPFAGSSLKSCPESEAQGQVGGNYQTGCDALGVRRPESLQVAKMADSSGRVGKSSGSGTGKGAVSAEQVRSRERWVGVEFVQEIGSGACTELEPFPRSPWSRTGERGLLGGDHAPSWGVSCWVSRLRKP